MPPVAKAEELTGFSPSRPPYPFSLGCDTEPHPGRVQLGEAGHEGLAGIWAESAGTGVRKR